MMTRTAALLLLLVVLGCTQEAPPPPVPSPPEDLSTWTVPEVVQPPVEPTATPVPAADKPTASERVYAFTPGTTFALTVAVDVPLDIYVECPDNIGGFVRYHEIAEIVRVAAPVYLKFGLRGTVDPYPAGGHLATTLVALSRERVRRARLGLDYLERARDEARTFVTSRPGAAGLAVPAPLSIRI